MFAGYKVPSSNVEDEVGNDKTHKDDYSKKDDDEQEIGSFGMMMMVNGRSGLSHSMLDAVCAERVYGNDQVCSLFVAPRTGHKIPNCLFGRLIVVQNGVHLLRNRHFDAITRSQPQGCGGALDTFGNLAVEAGEDIGKMPAFS